MLVKGFQRTHTHTKDEDEEDPNQDGKKKQNQGQEDPSFWSLLSLSASNSPWIHHIKKKKDEKSRRRTKTRWSPGDKQNLSLTFPFLEGKKKGVAGANTHTHTQGLNP